MKHTGVFTTYTSGGRAYGSYILAGSMNKAGEIARQRNIGETIISNPIGVDVMPDYNGLTDEEFLNQLPQIVHAAVFLGYIALSAETVTRDELLGDEGVIHKLTHLLDPFCREEYNCAEEIVKVRKQLYLLQKKVPGAFPAGHERKGYYIIVKIAPGSSRRIDNIVQGSEVFNIGDTEVLLCDCENDPDCMITDDDQPCGYHQTIEASMKGELGTKKDFVHIHNKSSKEAASVKIRVRGGKRQ